MARYPCPWTASCPPTGPVRSRSPRGPQLPLGLAGWFKFGGARRGVHHLQSPPAALAFYTGNSKLTTSGEKSVSAGEQYLGW